MPKYVGRQIYIVEQGVIETIGIYLFFEGI